MPKPAGAETRVSLRSVPWSRRSISRARGTRPGRHLGMWSLVSSSGIPATVCPGESTIDESYAKADHRVRRIKRRLETPGCRSRELVEPGSGQSVNTIT